MKKIRNSHFSFSTFFPSFGVLLLVAGIHAGLVVWLKDSGLHEGTRTAIIIAYWVLMSACFTMLTHYQMKRLYEVPMKELAKAADRVASGDFSVYVPPIHSVDKYDYLDVMIVDFNKMVEELGSIETLKTDFFSNVSHEIKTPIAVIQSSAEILQKTNLTEGQRQEYIETIIQSSKKLSALITNILKLNKLEKQNIQPVMEEYDLCEQLCICSLQFETIWEQKEIEFDVDVEDRLTVNLDSSLLELVWTNLLSNAFKFTPKHGKVVLRQTSSEDMVTVQVTDTGCGMNQDIKSHIFDKFYQGDTSHQAEGNGLGLALALRIVRMLDGDISVESEAGKGTCFTVSLPVGSMAR
ncbi:MAG: HAMP domain-containing sensor histidine kinase [Lachnospiraceae bacterium]|nr:HAMP domain-containing sensor histidine kinase [Lachnospiraceae bacterium]